MEPAWIYRTKSTQSAWSPRIAWDLTQSASLTLLTFDEEDEQTSLSNKYTTIILNPEVMEHNKKYLFVDYTRLYEVVQEWW